MEVIRMVRDHKGRTFKKKRKKINEAKVIQEIDDEFIRITAPIGGISYHPEFVRKGDGYECSIYVHEFTETVRAGWLSRFKLQNVVVSMCVYPQDKVEMENKIEKSLDEQLSRKYDPKTATLDIIKADRQIEELGGLAQDIDGAGEAVFKVAIRLLLFEPTFSALEKKVEEVLTKLKSYSFQGTVLMNEQHNELRSVFRPSDKDIIYRRHGVAMPASTFGAGFPFSFSQLNDPHGIPLGITDDGGAMVLDIFERTATRANYNACLFGLQRSGKSTLIKKLLKNSVILGNRVRALDPVGETVEVAQMFGGRIISLDGRTDVLNPLDCHIPFGEKLSRETFMSYIGAALSKGETFMSYITPELDANEVAIFSDILRKLYELMLPQKKQPLFSHVLKAVNHYLANNQMSENRRRQYENLETQLNRIINNYGALFNRPSSINTLDEDIVIYTLRDLSNFGPTVFQAQMFNILSLLWQETIIFGTPEKKAYEDGIKDIKDVRKFVVFADEAHHFLSSNNKRGIEFLVTMEREAPKYFGSFIWATHSIRDAVSDRNSETTELVEKLFEFAQYKFILKQDANAIRHLSKVFDNQMTEVELMQIASYRTGDVLLNISGDANYKFRVHVTDEELEIFKGGR